MDEDQDGSYERALSANVYEPTLITTSGETPSNRVNLEVLFPDRGALGGNLVTLHNHELGSYVEVSDPQAE